MEAPKKLYIAHREDYSDERVFIAYPEREFREGVEYTRTDAFIEKAKKCLIEWANVYVSKTTGEGVNKRKILANDLLNYFENYMKG